jgi:hypothetical protein
MASARTATKTTPRDLSAEVTFLTRALKAPTLRESVTRLAERARTESWTHEEFLVACLQRVETHRPQLDHDATVDKHGPLHTMRLRVVKPNNITSPQLASCDLVHRHAPSV